MMLSTFHGHLKIILEGHKKNRIYSDYLWGQGLVMDSVHLSLGAFLPEFSDMCYLKKNTNSGYLGSELTGHFEGFFFLIFFSVSKSLISVLW